MAWYWILLIVLAVLLCGGIITWLVLKRKKQKGADSIGKVQLVAVMRHSGSNRITGLETNEEVQARLAKLSYNEFIKENVIAYPYSQEQWHNSSEEEILARNTIEQKMLFAYDSDKKLNSSRSKYIRRIF